MYIVYKHQNKINNKCYIGITSKSLEHRLSQHLMESSNGSHFHFHKAIRKYGIESFESCILDEVETLEDANKKEIYYINEYNSFKDGYNMTLGGDMLYSFTKGKTYDEIYSHKPKDFVKEMQKSKSNKMKANKKSEETKRKMKENHWSKTIKNTWTNEKLSGKNISEEHKKNIGKGVKYSNSLLTEEEYKERYKHNVGKSNPNYGNTLSEENKQKLRDAAKIKVECPHCKQYFSRGMAKRWHFDNCKQKEKV